MAFDSSLISQTQAPGLDPFGDQDPFSQPFLDPGITGAFAGGAAGVDEMLVAPVEGDQGVGELSMQEKLDALQEQEKMERVGPNDYVSFRKTLGMALPFLAAMMTSKKQSDLNAALQGFTSANLQAQNQAMQRAQMENDAISRRYKDKIQTIRDERTEKLTDARIAKEREFNVQQQERDFENRQALGQDEHQYAMTRIFAGDHLETVRSDHEWERTSAHQREIIELETKKQLEIVRAQFGFDERLAAKAKNVVDAEATSRIIASMAAPLIAQGVPIERAYSESAQAIVPTLIAISSYDPKSKTGNEELNALLTAEGKGQLDVASALASMDIVNNPEALASEWKSSVENSKNAGLTEGQQLENAVRDTVAKMKSQGANTAAIREALMDHDPRLQAPEGKELIRRYTKDGLFSRARTTFGSGLNSFVTGGPGVTGNPLGALPQSDFINPTGSPLSGNF
jgi:hypothetical protein